MENEQGVVTMANSAMEGESGSVVGPGKTADRVDSSRGQKRQLKETADTTAPTTGSRTAKEPSQPTIGNDALTTTKDLPDGVTVSWNDNSSLVATFDFAASSSDDDDEIQLCLVGRARLRCLEGQAKVLGHRLTPESESISVTSPFWSSWITLNVSKADDSSVTTTDPSIAKVQVSSIRGTPSFRLVPPNRPTVIPLSWKTSVDKICKDFDEACAPVKDSLEEVSTYADHTKQQVIICGAKGVGKSTLLRYMTNQLLQSNDTATVAILDADVGQPELAPPGLLRLSLQRHPLLHPPYWNLCDLATPVEQISSVFFGAVTTKVNPTRYIEAIQRLVKDYHNFLTTCSTNIPLIINLDGWVKGMGYQILTTLLTTVEPSHVCQILGESKGKTFDVTGVVNPQQQPDTQLFFLDACTKHVTPCSIPAATLRTLRLATYFGSPHAPLKELLWDALDFMPAKQLQTGWAGDDACSLAHCLAAELPYCVPMETVEYCNAYTDTHLGIELSKDACVLQALNGNIVGLCTEDDICVGLGIVRSIDLNRRLFYVLTPIQEETLQSVTKFLGGNLPLPLPFVFRGVAAESFPYLKSAVRPINGDDGNSDYARQAILGAEPMKSRNNIGRRGANTAK